MKRTNQIIWIVCLICCVIAAAGYLAGLRWLGHVLFIVCIGLVISGIILVSIERKKLEKNIQRLERRCENIEDELKELKLSGNSDNENEHLETRKELKKEKRKLVKKINDKSSRYKDCCEIRKKLWTGFSCLAVFFVIVVTFSYSSSFFVSHPGGVAGPEGKTEDANEVPAPEPDIEQEDESDEVIEIDSAIRFILDDEQLEKEFTEELRQGIFFLYDTMDKEQSYEKVRNRFLEMTSDDTETDVSEGKNVSYETLLERSSSMEADFIKGEELTQKYAKQKDQEKWKESLQHSGTLQEIIDNRIQVWDAGRRTADLAFLIANNYQKLALECQNQDVDTEVVMAYYAESILWTENAIQYSLADKSKIDRYYDYVMQRYHDLRDLLSKKSFFSENRKQAQTMYQLLKDHKEDFLSVFE